MTPLHHAKLIWVTGKGGVGKSTVAAGVALAAAAAGRRTILCEVGEQDRFPRLFGRLEPAPGRELELRPNVNATSIDPRVALGEWVALQLHSRALSRLLSSVAWFQYFVAAAPGANELVTMGKFWDLVQPRRWERHRRPYDLVVVDAPSSGHGMGMLRAPGTFADIARVGPIHRQAADVADFLADPAATRYLAVALPEEMPVAETVTLAGELERRLRRRFDAVVVNAVFPRRFSAEDAAQLELASRVRDRHPAAARAALRAALSEHARVRGQQAQIARLRRGIQIPVLTLPFVFRATLELADVEQLGAELARKLDAARTS